MSPTTSSSTLTAKQQKLKNTLTPMTMVMFIVLVVLTIIPTEAISWSIFNNNEGNTTSTSTTITNKTIQVSSKSADHNILLVKDEEAQSLSSEQNDNEGDRTRIQIDGDLNEEIHTITTLDDQQQHQGRFVEPQQSSFLDQSIAHPTISQGADPRFAVPRRKEIKLIIIIIIIE